MIMHPSPLQYNSCMECFTGQLANKELSNAMQTMYSNKQIGK